MPHEPHDPLTARAVELLGQVAGAPAEDRERTGRLMDAVAALERELRRAGAAGEEERLRFAAAAAPLLPRASGPIAGYVSRTEDEFHRDWGEVGWAWVCARRSALESLRALLAGTEEGAWLE